MVESHKMLDPNEFRQSNDDLWDSQQVAEYLKVTIPTVRNHIKLRGLPCKRVGGRLYFRRSEVDAWVDAGGRAA